MKSEVFKQFETEYVGSRGVSMKNPVSITIRLPMEIVDVIDLISDKLPKSSRASVCSTMIQASYIDAAHAVDIDLDEFGMAKGESK